MEGNSASITSEEILAGIEHVIMKMLHKKRLLNQQVVYSEHGHIIRRPASEVEKELLAEHQGK